jgi:DnaJ-class molecular chaperone
MAARDYYEVLGVNRSANADEIRRAHRKLALQYHPDRNKDKSAPTRFAEIQQAYEVLSDDEKRKKYDEFIRLGGTTDAFAAGASAGGAGGGAAGADPFAGFRQGRPGAEWTSSDSATFESIFGDIFGGAGAGGGRRGRGNAGAGAGHRARARERMEYEVAVPLETLIRGGKYGISINNERHELEIPTGTEDEELLSIPGRLDVLVRVRADKHAWLTRDERDLSYDLPLSIVEATLGATIDAPLPTGGSVTLKIPAGTASGKKMRIAGKGMPAANGKPAGDLYVVVQIVPPKEPNDLTKSLLKEIGGTIENPRARIAHLRG